MRQPVPFGKYLLLDRISVGGMAEVFKAKSYGVEGFEKIIAIKRILPTMGEDRDFIKMFIDEAKIAGQLAHANICQIFELGRIDGSHFIAMEYIWGKDLLQIQNRLRKIKQPMPVAMACFVIAKVLEGLDYAHRKRDPLGRPLEIVHRDCSPQNVLVSYEGEVKVIDFGIAKATSRNSRTMAGVLKGKFGYMSPEQVRGLPLDRRSDIFALGTMLYECLTSERLFQGETDFSTLEKVRNVDIRPPRELNPNIPESVERVILKALAKDVEDRYQWCSEMLADLQQFLMSQDVVFTAKSLSGWLKEVFSSEIERERQQLEQYKRVGRDGLIAGAPAAVAKVDLVETLGEAGTAEEADATQLGGPDFEALEKLVNANAQPQLARPQAPEVGEIDDDDAGEFGEEAPTEIFGELDTSSPPSSQMPVASSPRAGSQPPMSRPRPPTPSQQPQQYAAASGPGARTMIAPQGANNPTMTVSDDQIVSPQSQADARAAYAQQFPGLAQPSQGYPQQYAAGAATQMANGTPGAMPSQPLSAMAPPGQPQGRTLMGAAPPPGVPNYSQGGYPQHLSNPQMPNAMQNPMMGYPQYGSMSNPQMHPSSPQMNPMAGYPQYNQPYGSQPGYGQAVTPLVETAHVSHLPASEGKRKSSIGRDVGIGVAIAAIVLGGFLAVKFLILDSDDGDTKATSSTIATIRIAMPEGVTAELYVDEAKVAQAVKNNLEVPVSAGQRKIKLIGPNGSRCESEMKLAAGKVTTVECIMHAGSAAPATGSGSAVSASTQPTTGSGSATQVATADKDKAATDKAAAEKDKAAADKAAADKAAADKAAADKAAADKAAADKAAKAAAEKDKDRDKPPADKDKTSTKPKDTSTKPKDKMPVEENPIDRAASLPSKGYVKIIPPKDAQTLVDGAAPSGSLSKLPLSPGKHKVQFIIGSDKHSFSVMVKAGETITLDKHDLQ